MYETGSIISQITGLLLAVVWAYCGFRLGGFRHRPTYGKRRRAARASIGWILLGTVGAGVQVACTGLMLTAGWEFGGDLLFVALPVLLLPLAVALRWTLPTLMRAVRTEVLDRSEPVGALDRAAATDPRLVVPVQATAVGALFSFYAVFLHRALPPFVVDAFILLALLAAATMVLWLRQQRRQQRTAQTGHRHLVLVLLKRVAVFAVVVAGLVGGVAYGAQASRLPGNVDMHAGGMDWGGGPEGVAHAHDGHAHGGGAGSGSTTSVANLTGPQTGTPDARFTLTARAGTIRLSSGERIDGWTYNGQAPGPELRVREGDLVEVTLVNRLPDAGVTVHWHGLDVPNAEDGVAGVTQNAVQPGERHVYRFVAEQVGTFWYHSHQVSDQAVQRGLFGALIVLPRDGAGEPERELTVLAHRWQVRPGRNIEALGIADRLRRERVDAGTRMRLRLVNTTNKARAFGLSGTPFRVTAIDGARLNRPTELDGVQLDLGAGGRYDVEFTMPDRPVRLANLDEPDAAIVLSPDGTGDVAPVAADAAVFDPLRYGTPTRTPFGPDSDFDRRFQMILDDGPAFYDGSVVFGFTFNGELAPHAPTFMVREGDLVRVRIVNRSDAVHPMHPHGHHVLVLARNGEPSTGSPWWSDTLNVWPGQSFDIAFRADNPGLWMDHCHNLDHAATGMTTHLAYAGVQSPFQVGRTSGNKPE
jgi:FtsP/CotA-like multicopper oxidase with cupredoxin domain